MKSITPRERFMVLLLPSAIILLIYFFLIVPSVSDAKQGLLRQSDALKSQAPSPSKRMETQRAIIDLGSKIRSLEEKASENDPKRTKRVFSSQEVEQANARLEALLEENGVILLEESRTESSGRRLYQNLLSKRPKAELSQLELAGTFAAVSTLVQSLDQTGPALVPVALEMDATMQSETNLRRWTLWICR